MVVTVVSICQPTKRKNIPVCMFTSCHKQKEKNLIVSDLGSIFFLIQISVPIPFFLIQAYDTLKQHNQVESIKKSAVLFS